MSVDRGRQLAEDPAGAENYQAKPWWARYSTIGHYYTGTLRAPPPIVRTIVDDEARDELHRG